MKVLWLTNIPSPYRVDFFNELGKKCDLTVLFEKKSSDERDESWKKFKIETFRAVYLKGKSVGVAEAFCPGVIKYLSHTYDHIVVTNFSDPTGMLAIAMLRAKKISYIIESDGGFAGSGQGIKEKIKKWLLSGAHLYFSTAKEHDKYYLTYGARKEQIVRYPFTSLKNRDILPTIPSILEKKQLRSRLNINEAKVIVSVGRFSYRDGYGKGYDILLTVAEKMGNDYGFYIVGDEPTDEFLDWKAKRKLNNVHFIGYQKKDELSLYYRAADVFTLLSRGEAWGLVVNEAMAHGLPVIASDKTVAAQELVHNGKNGYVVSVDDKDMIATYLTKICEDNNLQSNMAKESINIINRYTIENMSIEHIEIFSGGGYRRWIRNYYKHFLGLPNKKMILAVGQFIYRKGYDLLLDAADQLQEMDISFVLIGGSPPEAFKQFMEKQKISNVIFLDFQPKEKLREYYLAADLFVHPTREDIWGLVVNEAMAQGLPVITTKRCVAGLELICEPAYGQIIPVDDVNALTNAIRFELGNLSEERTTRILKKIKQYTVEQMARAHMECLERI